MKARILVVEDELAMRVALVDSLRAEGYRVLVANDGAEGLDVALAQVPDLILLDVMMPALDGFALCRELRRLDYSGPIVMVTAKGMVDDRVQGLDVGADDYLVKPFSIDELLARVRAQLRRCERQEKRCDRLLIGEVAVDFVRQTATRQGQSLHLTSKEFAVLRLLVDAGGEAVSRRRFLDLVWGVNRFPTTRTVDNHIAMLRQKLGTDDEDQSPIQTVHGVGYRLEHADFASS